MNIELTTKEHDYLRTLVGMDQRLKNERLLNAAANKGGRVSQHFHDPDMQTVEGILIALGAGQLDHLMNQTMLQLEGIEDLDENKK